MKKENVMKLKRVECLWRGVIIIMDLGSMLVKEESEHKKEERNNEKVVKH